MRKSTIDNIYKIATDNNFAINNISGNDSKSAKITVTCCNGHTKTVYFQAFKNRPICYECIPHCNLMSKEKFIEKLNQKNKKCKLEGEYTKASDMLKFRCLTCGESFEMRGTHALQGHSCKECALKEGRLRFTKSHEDFVKEINEKYNNEYEVLSDYISESHNIKVKHTKCGKVSVKKAGTLIQNGGCKYCRESKGEKRISEILSSNHIEFVREYKDARCRYKKILPFDFAIFIKSKLKYLIEYDGELHYNTARWSNASDRLQLTLIKDNIKSSFAKENGIKLIRIPYWEFDNIEKILKHELRALF